MHGDCALSPFYMVPDSVLLQSILPWLDAPSLGLLACCSRRFRQAASSDLLWFPFCRGLQWLLPARDWQKISFDNGTASPIQPPPYPWLSWHHLFSFKQNRKCVECGEDTPYVHTLSRSRPLCERCEYACPKYAVVTKLEAKQRYLLTDQDLGGLPNKKICCKRFSVYFFLKSDVESAAAAKGTQEGQASGCNSEGEGIELGKEENANPLTGSSHMKMKEPSEVRSQNTLSGLQSLPESEKKDSESMSSDDDIFESSLCVSQLDHEGNANSVKEEGQFESPADEDKAHKKELRKEHKRQVKAAKREKRVSGISIYASEADQGRQYTYKADKKTSRVHRTMKPHPSTQHSSRSSQSPQESKDTDKLKKNKWRTKREHVINSNLYREGQTMECNLKWKSKFPSEWVREREWLEVELGPYGFSALELAPQCWELAQLMYRND